MTEESAIEKFISSTEGIIKLLYAPELLMNQREIHLRFLVNCVDLYTVQKAD